MVQVKKKKVEEAITTAAYELFMAHGYSGTRMPQIAKAAGISASSIYVYFDSKLDILTSVYEIWFANKLQELKVKIRKCATSAQVIKVLCVSMWQELPAADNGFCGVLIEALSDRANQKKYSPQLRFSVERALIKLLNHSLPGTTAQSCQSIVNILIMAFDGYALNYHLREGETASDSDVDTLYEMILRTYLQARPQTLQA